MGDYKLTITTTEDGVARLGITHLKRLFARTLYVDLSAEDAEMVAMNLLSRAMGH